MRKRPKLLIELVYLIIGAFFIECNRAGLSLKPSCLNHGLRKRIDWLSPESIATLGETKQTSYHLEMSFDLSRQGVSLLTGNSQKKHRHEETRAFSSVGHGPFVGQNN